MPEAYKIGRSLSGLFLYKYILPHGYFLNIRSTVNLQPIFFMELSYYGHACFGLTIGGHRLLIDPFISPNPLAAHIDVASIEADFILISHAHGDHIADAVSIAQRTGAQIVSNYEIITWFEEQGIKGGHPMNIGGSWAFPFGKLHLVYAAHSSAFPDGRYGGNPAGFIIETEAGNLYYSGDTALTYDMKLIAEKWKLDLAILCIGDNFTMGYQDAAIAAEFIGCDRIVGMHYDTFPYVQIDHSAAQAAFSAKGKALTLLEIGGRLLV